MPSRVVVGPRNFWDEATLTVSSAAVSTYEIQNTQNSVRHSVWLHPSGSAMNIEGTFADGLTRYPDCFSLFRHKLQGGDIQLRLYSDDAWATLTYDSTALPAFTTLSSTGRYDWGIDVVGAGRHDPAAKDAPYAFYFSPIACRSFRVNLSGTLAYGNTAWEISRGVLCRTLELGFNFTEGLTLAFDDNSISDRDGGGSLRSQQLSSWALINGDFEGLTDYEREAWVDILGYCKTGGDVFLSVYPNNSDKRLERDWTRFGKFVALDALGKKTNHYTKRVQFQEG